MTSRWGGPRRRSRPSGSFVLRESRRIRAKGGGNGRLSEAAITLQPMMDHFGVQVRDVAASAAYFVRVFAPLGIKEVMRFPVFESYAVGFAGPDGNPQFWISPNEPATEPSRGLHIAFAAAGRPQVDAVHEIAVADGIEVLHSPREWPEYHPGYYAVFLRDPDGNNVEAVCHRQ